MAVFALIIIVLNIPYVEVVIDFIDVPYEVNETNGVANVTVGVVRGQLMRKLVVELSLSDGTAIGKQCLINHCSQANLYRCKDLGSMLTLSTFVWVVLYLSAALN